ncbi:molybdenum cofactor biosynthesis protein 1-like [Eupeodes corollae]|uniref:molybdenum cofactor biosynthesis protein 1-like n=1 Tax=Eupeodes corollae TaxID=290404 RepID=UPI0024913FBF|nr:molybdenum cofactor biosynthesis protein 1-like [Eupeodes corollae]
MVDVSQKNITDREATAKATVEVGPKIAQLIKANNMSKGDVLSIAQLAGIMGAKKTSEIIPLCHNIFLSSVKVNAILDEANNSVNIMATVRCTGKTGVEMEALTACSIAALTVYDMCKAVSHEIVIKDVRLCEKSGGKRYFKHNNDL